MFTIFCSRDMDFRPLCIAKEWHSHMWDVQVCGLWDPLHPRHTLSLGSQSCVETALCLGEET